MWPHDRQAPPHPPPAPSRLQEEGRGSDLLHCLVLRGGRAVIRVLLRAGVGALADLPALLVLVRQLLHVPVGLAAAQPPDRACQPLAQRVPRALGARGALGAHHVGLQGGHGGGWAGVVTGDGQRVWRARETQQVGPGGLRTGPATFLVAPEPTCRLETREGKVHSLMHAPVKALPNPSYSQRRFSPGRTVPPKPQVPSP